MRSSALVLHRETLRNLTLPTPQVRVDANGNAVAGVYQDEVTEIIKRTVSILMCGTIRSIIIPSCDTVC